MVSFICVFIIILLIDYLEIIKVHVYIMLFIIFIYILDRYSLKGPIAYSSF